MSGFQQMRENFEAQFEPAGENSYLYRRNLKGEPIPVTADERALFIRRYVWGIRFATAGMIAGLLLFWGLVIWLTLSSGADLPEPLMYAGTAVIAAAGIGMFYWIGGAPARQLRGRSPVGQQRSNDELRAMLFKKLSYGQLAGLAVVGALLPFTLRGDHDVLHGWGRLWLVFGASIVLLAAVQALRKWRFESQHPEDFS